MTINHLATSPLSRSVDAASLPARLRRGVHFIGKKMVVVTSDGRLAMPAFQNPPRSRRWRENARAAGAMLLDDRDPV